MFISSRWHGCTGIQRTMLLSTAIVPPPPANAIVQLDVTHGDAVNDAGKLPAFLSRSGCQRFCDESLARTLGLRTAGTRCARRVAKNETECSRCSWTREHDHGALSRGVGHRRGLRSQLLGTKLRPTRSGATTASKLTTLTLARGRRSSCALFVGHALGTDQDGHGRAPPLRRSSARRRKRRRPSAMSREAA